MASSYRTPILAGPHILLFRGQTVIPILAGGVTRDAADVMLINAQIPSGISMSGAVPLVVQMGQMQAGVTIPVQ